MKVILFSPENSHTITIPVLLVINLKIFKKQNPSGLKFLPSVIKLDINVKELYDGVLNSTIHISSLCDVDSISLLVKPVHVFYFFVFSNN